MEILEDFYTTVAEEASDEFEEKRSRFIGYAIPAPDEETALSFVKKIKALHPNATHNVYAYRIRGGIYARYSDDGEPQGTAGIPILEVIKKAGADNVCVVVTRYFGGTLLGAGGLVRAYSHGAKIALDAARIVTYEKHTEWSVSCQYADYGKYTLALERLNAIVDDTVFEDVVTIKFCVKTVNEAKVETEFRELSGGKVFPLKIGERYAF